MSLFIFLKVLAICLVGAMSPGPSMVVVINNAIFKNRYHGIITSIGHGIGISIYAVFAVIGIGMVIKTNLILFNSIKIVSIIFLIYMGVKSIFNKEDIDFENKNIMGGTKSFFQGFAISILNPKILIWFIAIYSQFMSEKNAFLFNAYLVITAGIVDSVWYMFLTVLTTSSVSLNFVKKNHYVLNKITGYIFILIGMALFVDIYF
ncbi:LysE type translocator [alpha proteobacterium HIMB59]|nr:LysE type translocator [alpha proteobacterium HIMB59]